jgi:hypothetical protein
VSHLNEADEMIELDWVEGEPESLPFGDHSFDRVLSAFGHMFVPRHEAVAGELKGLPRGRRAGPRGLDARGPRRREVAGQQEYLLALVKP